MNWEEIRSNYPLIENATYFNTAYFGPLSKRTVSTQKAYLDKLSETGSGHFSEWGKDADIVRSEIQKLTNAQEYSIGFSTDVSTGINLIADTFSRKERVVLLKGDFPAVNVPWIVRDYDIHWVGRKEYAFDLADIRAGLESGAKIVAVSWVMYNSGYVLDLKALSVLCKEFGATLIVDATQGLGVLPIDLSDIQVDVMFASTFKWFLSGYGIAVALISNEFEKRHALTFAGQNSISSSHKGEKDQSRYKNGAKRFEMGHVKSQQIESLKSSIVELSEFGFENIQDRTRTLTSSLRQKLEEAGRKVLTPSPQQSSILIFAANEGLHKNLVDANVNCTYRDGYIRLALYFYNNNADIEHLIAVIKS